MSQSKTGNLHITRRQYENEKKISLGQTMVLTKEKKKKSWLKQGASGPRDTLFFACVWWTWKARNAKCFEDELIPCTRLMLAVLNLAETLKVCFKAHTTSAVPARQISWLQKDRLGIVLNVDGSNLGNPGPAGFGGLLRYSEGGWLLGFSGHIGHADVLKAELLGLYNGLELALGLRPKRHFVLHRLDECKNSYSRAQYSVPQIRNNYS